MTNQKWLHKWLSMLSVSHHAIQSTGLRHNHLKKYARLAPIVTKISITRIQCVMLKLVELNATNTDVCVQPGVTYENPIQIQLWVCKRFCINYISSRSLWFWCNAMKYQTREEICNVELERESKGEWIIGFMILFLLFTVYTAQPAKDGIKPQPIYQQVSKWDDYWITNFYPE